jgi:hypothetical protein
MSSIATDVINTFLRNAIDTILQIPGYTVKADQLNAPRPRGAHGSVEFLTLQAAGLEEYVFNNRIDDDIDVEMSYMGQCSMTLAFYKDNAIDNAIKVRYGLAQTFMIDLFSIAKLGLLQRSIVINLTSALESGFEQRSQFDVTLSTVGSETQIVNSISSIEILSKIQTNSMTESTIIEVP